MPPCLPVDRGDGITSSSISHALIIGRQADCLLWSADPSIVRLSPHCVSYGYGTTRDGQNSRRTNLGEILIKRNAHGPYVH